MESARVRGLASQLDRSASSALESVMADYNKTIMERYHIFLLDYGKTVENEKEAQLRWKTYFKKEADNTMGNLLYVLFFDSDWFSITNPKCNIQKTWTPLDENGELLANQIVQYMKYKEVGDIVSDLLEQIKIIQKGVEGQDKLDSAWKKEKIQEEKTQNEEMSFVIGNILQEKSIDVSSEKISSWNLPSRMKGISSGELKLTPIWNDISEEVLIGEYILEYFSSYYSVGKENKDNKEKMLCQQEYILFGNLSDKENMKSMENILMSVRCGLNLISLLSSESMQAIVETTALTMSSAVLMPELSPLFQVILNCVWTYRESKHDVETLLKGQSVPFLKEESQWVESILSFGETEEKELESAANDKKEDSDVTQSVIGDLIQIGTTQKKFYSVNMLYEDYIRIFLLFVSPETKCYRIMDMMQVEMQKQYPNFMIQNCICGMEAVATVKSKPKFFMFLPVNTKKKYELTRMVSFLY